MMASNNYYGFTHAGTQYGNSYTPVAPTGYPMVAQTYAANPRAGYDQSYGQQSGQTVPNYDYNTRPQTSTGAVGYGTDGSQYANNVQNTAYPYSTGYTNSYNAVVTNYAANTLYSQQTTGGSGAEEQTSAIYSNSKSSNNWNFKKHFKGNKMKNTKNVQQLHYCDVCKISCAGPQTYKEHLDGQRHKKKEQQMKAAANASNSKRQASSAATSSSSGSLSLRCELCDVTCTGNDAYAAHIRGTKHQKVIKLHTKLGKPIPSNDPVVVSPNSAKTTKTGDNGNTGSTGGQAKIKVLGTPRINFIGGGRLHTTNSGELKEESFSDQTNNTNASGSEQQDVPNQTQDFAVADTIATHISELDKNEAQPVGQDYIDESKSDDLKGISFHCKLCDCRFNDPNAKEMHLKGRRHRLQYKKKVDPNLVVEVKPSLKNRKHPGDSKERRNSYKQNMHYWNDWYSSPNRYYDPRPMGPPMHQMPPSHMGPPPPPGFAGANNFMGSPSMPPHFRRTNSSSWDDIHIMQKHSEICPKEEELDEIHHLVSCVERALKLVSDNMVEEDTTTAMNEMIKKEMDELSTSNGLAAADGNSKDKLQESSSESSNVGKPEESQYRLMKGLMRVGPLAKGLLLTGDKEVDLVVICSKKPTKHLLQRIVDLLPTQLQIASSIDSFDIIMKVHDSGLSIATKNEPKITANVTLTSPLVREENANEGMIAAPDLEMVKEPQQLLDRQKCVEALAALRHSKWFQARVANLQPCPIVIRLFRDLCRRLPTWSKLSLWAIELLCEKVISSAGEPLTPGEALRHTFEAISSGILLPGGTGLADPCEKEPTDALAALTRQEREDITSSAQHALRLIAFRQIYKILGVDPLPQKQRKRRLDSENDATVDTEVENKKEKKDDTVIDNNNENTDTVTQMITIT
ncbi:zinc finger RNA-binding protein-like [Oppia nitens]|uniref:zinc finger RNA-binding protein-like n=1 Tax=Oppia nitens TaxID=1686743 RepID=UPI0023D9B1CA|nr:zinc finger RNA-binding protein-like [Oppia nitens]